MLVILFYLDSRSRKYVCFNQCSTQIVLKYGQLICTCHIGVSFITHFNDCQNYQETITGKNRIAQCLRQAGPCIFISPRVELRPLVLRLNCAPRSEVLLMCCDKGRNMQIRGVWQKAVQNRIRVMKSTRAVLTRPEDTSSSRVLGLFEREISVGSLHSGDLNSVCHFHLPTAH